MNTLYRPLLFMQKHGRLVLIAGLVVGIVLPDLALFVQSILPELLFGLLFFAALRIGPRNAFGNLDRVAPLLGVIAGFQVVLPCAIALIFALLGLQGVLPTAIILLCAAAPITGSPNLTVMMNGDAAPSLRLLILSTSMLPLTVLPVFSLTGIVGDMNAVFSSVLRLLMIILVSSSLAFALRWKLLAKLSDVQIQAIDGMSSFLMAFLVVGLMSAFGPALFETPVYLLMVLALTIALNMGLQMAGYYGVGSWVRPNERIAYAIGGGNRNTALFIAALPFEVMRPLLLFIACYQIPMYLTPYLLGWLYKDGASHDMDR